jgi:F0F1-type ATP synthase assembly protein I
VADPETERASTVRRQGAAYQGAFEAVLAILISAGIGYWADAKFGTSPVGLLVGVAVGFAAFVLRLVRLGRGLRERAADAGAGPERASRGERDGPGRDD